MDGQKPATLVDGAASRNGPWGLGFDRSPLPMWVEEEGTRHFLAVNDAAIAKYGHDRDRFLALTLGDLEIGTPAGGVSRHRRADGTEIEVKVERNRLEVDGGTVWLAVVTETHDQAVRESEERFRQLFEAASDGFWEADAKGRMTYVSPSYEATFGSSAADVLGKRLQDFPGVSVTPEAAEKAIAAMRQHLPFRDFVYARQSLTTQKVRWVHTNCVPVFDKNGEFHGYRGIARDVTDQIEAEQALRNSEQRFRQMFELASDFYWEFDASYRYTYCSPGWEALHGMPFAEALGKRLVELPGVSTTPEMGKMVLLAQQAKQPFRDFVYSSKSPSGETRWISACGMPIFDDRASSAATRASASRSRPVSRPRWRRGWRSASSTTPSLM